MPLRGFFFLFSHFFFFFFFFPLRRAQKALLASIVELKPISRLPASRRVSQRTSSRRDGRSRRSLRPSPPVPPALAPWSSLSCEFSSGFRLRLSAFDPRTKKDAARRHRPKIFSVGRRRVLGGSGASPTAQRRAVASDVPTATLLRADEVIEKRSLLAGQIASVEPISACLLHPNYGRITR